MRGAVPEDKGDKDQVTQTYFNWTFYWLWILMTTIWVSSGIQNKCQSEGVQHIPIQSLSSLPLVEKLHLNKDFKPIY